MLGPQPLSANVPLYPAGSRYENVARHVLGVEGGLAYNPADRGGLTKFGISLRFLLAEGSVDRDHDGLKDFDLDMDGDIDGADVRLLTPQQALNLFYECFWRRLQLDRLSKPMDGAVFDQAVNGGCVAAVKMLQRSLNAMPLGDQIAVDGALGNQTMAYVGRAIRAPHGVDVLLANYRRAAEDRYNAICRADHSQVEFLNGWVQRARCLGDV